MRERLAALPRMKKSRERVSEREPGKGLVMKILTNKQVWGENQLPNWKELAGSDKQT